jgi:hypothetical protein
MVAMPPISYIEEWNPYVHQRVRARFRRDIDSLSSLGFRELALYGEQFGLFSTILSVPISLLMVLKREVMRVDRGLRVNASFILMCNDDPTTVALPLALGVKLYTGFTDGTVLLSTNFPSGAVSNQAVSVVKPSSKVATADAWVTHQRHARELEAQGKRIHRSVGFDYYVELSRQEETAF